MDALPTSVAAVLDGFGFDAAGARGGVAPSGLIQLTWLVTLADGRRLVVQRMHPVFGTDVLDDIDAITCHLARRGLETPRLLRAPSGRLFHLDDEARPWRVLEYLEGHTVDRVERPAMAAEAGRLAARFHAALADLEHEFRFVRAGVHDTARHLGRLEAALAADPGADAGLVSLAERILEESRGLPALGELPRRIVHGDLKISNVLFAGDPPRARALIDLDTLGRGTLAHEMGDALRSWCNPLGEDVERTRFDLDVFTAAVGAYLETVGDGLAGVERDSLVPGLRTVCVELAARFCVDAFEDRYFGWDPRRFPSRREHNRVRATGQLALARDVARHEGDAAAVVQRHT